MNIAMQLQANLDRTRLGLAWVQQSAARRRVLRRAWSQGQLALWRGP